MNERMAALYGDGNVERLRVPPQAVEAEQSVLGAFLIPGASEALWPKVCDWLHAEDFYRRDHQLIFAAVRDLCERSQPCDAVTLGEWFDSQGLAEQVSGGAYLVDLASGTPSAANAVAYAEIVVDKAKLRQLITIGTGMVNDGFQPNGRDTRELIAKAQREVGTLAGNPRVGGIKTTKDVGLRWYAELQRRYSNKGGLLGLPTPWAKFNAMTAGLKPGELIVIAGRPSMGKSALAINIATANAMQSKRVMFFNLEMTDVSIYDRAAASISGVPLQWLRFPNDEDEENWQKVTTAVRKLNDAGLLIDDEAGLGREQIIARAKREHQRGKLDMVVVDHLHLMPLPGKTRESVEVGEITRDLKALAKYLGCPVILLSQLNRSLEARANKRPMMADLRESGNIEQDADLIVFVYRDDYYAEREGRPSQSPGMVEIIISKQREGETGTVWARNRLAYGLVEDYEGEYAISLPQPARNARGMRSEFES